VKKHKEKMKEKHLVLVGWIIDGTGARVLKDMALEVNGGFISTVRKSSPADREETELTDYSQCTLLPGLVDSHVHLVMSGSEDPGLRKQQCRASYGEARNTIKGHVRAHLASGVLAVRDGGDCGGYTRRYRKETTGREVSPLNLRVAGRAWHAPFRYGRLLGRAPIQGHSLAQSISRAWKGVDHVKIINSGLNSLSDFGKETSPQFSLADLAEAAEKGRRLGLKLMVHANGELPVRVAIQAGCASIEHGFFMGRDNLSRMAEKGIFWVPTAFTMGAYARMSHQGSVQLDVAERNLEHQLEQLRIAEECGVRIALGTDAGSVGVNHGKAVREEMKVFISAGLSLEKTIQCASSRGAELLNLGNELGTLAPGQPASFVVVQGGPDRLPDSLGDPKEVYVRGQSIKPFDP
jgi:imidazolonepropionase-like amidohydrolase